MNLQVNFRLDFVDNSGNEYRRFRTAIYEYDKEGGNTSFMINEKMYRIDLISGRNIDTHQIEQSTYNNKPILQDDKLVIYDRNNGENGWIIHIIKMENPDESIKTDIDWNKYLHESDTLWDPTINEDRSLPLYILFLDMDGVLMQDRFSSWMSQKIWKKLEELHGKRESQRYTDLEYAITHSHLLNEKAIRNLNALLLKLNEISRVRIVVSSSWREHGSEEDVVDLMFKSQPFSRFIIGRTPIIKRSNRGYEISQWLSQKRQSEGVDGYVIFDDYDDKIAEFHKDRFIETHPSELLTRLDMIQAYNILTK